jgi:hypothetical protein
MANAVPTDEKSAFISRSGASRQFKLPLSNDAATTGKFVFKGFDVGNITLPAGFLGTLLTFYSSSWEGGLLAPAYTDAEPPVAVTRTVSAGKSYPIPAALAGAHEIGILSNQAAGATEIIQVQLKA